MADGCATVLTEHEDVLIEILARLPVKSLLRFRCVCTTWRSLISNPHFINKHMKHDADLRLLFSMNPPSSMGLVDLKPLEDAELAKPFTADRVPTRTLDFPVSLESGSPVVNVGSCNGIICILSNRGEFALWNPCTGDCNVLPKPSGVSCHPRYCGFGYDEINDDYKVVKGSNCLVKPIIQVFSLRRGTWKTYPGPEKNYMRGQGGFVNGRLHWLWFEDSWQFYSSEIRPFDLAEEKFEEAKLVVPEFLWNSVRGILISGDRLCICGQPEQCIYGQPEPLRIMMMKEYGVKESWTEVLHLNYHIVPEIYDEIVAIRPRWILENGDVLAFTVQSGCYLSLYKPKDKKFRNVIKTDESTFQFESVIYRETLVSPVTGSLRDI